MPDTLTDSAFPCFASFQDLGVEPNVQGNDSARTMEEAYALAELRVLHGSQEACAYVYKGAVGQRAKVKRKYFWNDLKVVYEDWYV